MRKTCKNCGKVFNHNFNIYCYSCIKIKLAEEDKGPGIYSAPESDINYDFDDFISYDMDPVAKPRHRKKPQILKDVKAANEAGLSYGEYMARKEGR